MRPFIAGLATVLVALPLCAAVDTNSPAPDFTLNAQSGPPVGLTQFKGQVVMLNFWASWCGPCRQEMPLLDSIYKKYGKLGFTHDRRQRGAGLQGRQRLAEADSCDLSDTVRYRQQGQ